MLHLSKIKNVPIISKISNTVLNHNIQSYLYKSCLVNTLTKFNSFPPSFSVFYHSSSRNNSSGSNSSLLKPLHKLNVLKEAKNVTKQPFDFNQFRQSINNQTNLESLVHLLKKMFDDDMSWTNIFITSVIDLQQQYLLDLNNEYFKDPKVINLFIKYYLRVSQYSLIEELIKYMDRNKIKFNVETRRLLIDFYLIKSDFTKVEILLESLNNNSNNNSLEKDLSSDSNINSIDLSLIRMKILLHKQKLDEALEIFINTNNNNNNISNNSNTNNNNKDIRLFHAYLYDGCCKYQRYDELYTFFSTYIDSGFRHYLNHPLFIQLLDRLYVENSQSFIMLLERSTELDLLNSDLLDYLIKMLLENKNVKGAKYIYDNIMTANRMKYESASIYTYFIRYYIEENMVQAVESWISRLLYSKKSFPVVVLQEILLMFQNNKHDNPELIKRMVERVGGRMATIVIYNELVGNHQILRKVLDSFAQYDKLSVLLNRIIKSYLIFGLYSHAAHWYNYRVAERHLAPDSFLYIVLRHYHSKLDTGIEECKELKQLIDMHYVSLKESLNLDSEAKDKIISEMTSYNPGLELSLVGKISGQHDSLMRTIYNLKEQEKLDDQQLSEKFKESIATKTTNTSIILPITPSTTTKATPTINLEEMIESVEHIFKSISKDHPSTFHAKLLLVYMLKIQKQSNQKYLDLYAKTPSVLKSFLLIPSAIEQQIRVEPHAMIPYIEANVDKSFYQNSNSFANSFLIACLNSNQIDYAMEMINNFASRRITLSKSVIDSMANKLLDKNMVSEQLVNQLLDLYPTNEMIDILALRLMVNSGNYNEAYQFYHNTVKNHRSYSIGFELFLHLNSPTHDLNTINQFLGIPMKKISFYLPYLQLLHERGHFNVVKDFCKANHSLLFIRSQQNHSSIPFFWNYLYSNADRIQLFKTLPSTNKEIIQSISEINAKVNDDTITELLAKSQESDTSNSVKGVPPPLTQDDFNFIKENYMNPKVLKITPKNIR